MNTRASELKYVTDTLKEWFPYHNLCIDNSQQEAVFELQYADMKVMQEFCQHLNKIGVKFNTIDARRITLTEKTFNEALSKYPFGDEIYFSAHECLGKLLLGQQMGGAGAGNFAEAKEEKEDKSIAEGPPGGMELLPDDEEQVSASSNFKMGLGSK